MIRVIVDPSIAARKEARRRFFLFAIVLAMLCAA